MTAPQQDTYVALSVLAATVAGSAINIPVIHTKRTLVAVNVGGCIMPSLVSLYLLLLHLHYVLFATTICTAVCAALSYYTSRLVRGVGITTPLLVVPVVCATLCVLFVPEHATSLAFVAASMGTLVGADILNMTQLSAIDVPLIVVGGRGFYDSIVVSALIATALATVL